MSHYFTTETDPKLACPCCGEAGVEEGFLLLLDQIREEVGVPLTITSGYRCPDYNSRISKTGATGPHTRGQAVDIACTTSQLRLGIIQAAINQRVHRIGIAKTFVHLDILDEFDGFPENVMWVY